MPKLVGTVRILALAFSAYCLSCGNSSNSVAPAQSSPDSHIPLIEQPSSYGIQPSFFGFHIHRIGTGTPWPSIPFGTWDLWDSHVQWPDLEPQRGVWNFSTLDMYADEARQHGVELIYTLGLTPQWASARPAEKCPYGLGEAAEPANFQDWKDYIRKIATRYKGKIHYYILWNEPNLAYFFTGTTDTLIELSKEAYEILKSVDPSIQVLSPSGFHVAWAQSFLSKGGGQYFDVVASHLYTIPYPPEHTVAQIEAMSALLLQFGMPEKPIWNTEVGWYGQTVSDSEGVADLSRLMILNAANGIQRFAWYAWDDHEWAKIWVTETDNTTLAPAGVAFREIEKWLAFRTVQCESSSQPDSPDAALWVCTVNSPDGFNGHIVWITSGTTNFEIPGSWNALNCHKPDGSSGLLNDLRTYRVTPTPVLFDNAAQ